MNGKFFVPATPTTENLKVIFNRATASGAGKPVDSSGVADGPWTPEGLTQAICAIEGNKAGIDLRTVQNWFQDNDIGISDRNIHWLSRIFGCGDAIAISQWQVELKAAKGRLKSERRERRSVQNGPSVGSDASQSGTAVPNRSDQTAGFGLAIVIEKTLSGRGAINLLIAHWLVFCGLGLFNYVVGTLDVTYTPVPGLEKQVGFIWAPTLTILPLIVLPAYVYFTSALVTYWKDKARPLLLGSARASSTGQLPSWPDNLGNFSISFWALLLFSLFFVFGFQWFGIYLPAYLSGDGNSVQIDRYLIALVRPEVISVPTAMVLSAIGYLYTASYIAIFLFGLLLQIIVVIDFHRLARSRKSDAEASNIRRQIIWGCFRTCVAGLWLAILIKMQVTYLSSDAPNVLVWLLRDLESILGLADFSNGRLENSSISHFTTFMMMMDIFAVLLFTVIWTGAAARHANHHHLFRSDLWIIVLVTMILTSNVVLLGSFTGFTMLVFAGVIVSSSVFFGPKHDSLWAHHE